MVTICDGCGKKYGIDPKKIKGDSARFKCNSCGQIITVQKPLEKPKVRKPEIKSMKEKYNLDWIILGCTELSMLFQGYDLSTNYLFDPLLHLVDLTIRYYFD